MDDKIFSNILSGCHAFSILLLFAGCQTGRSQTPESQLGVYTQPHKRSCQLSLCALLRQPCHFHLESKEVIIQRGLGSTGNRTVGSCIITERGRERSPQHLALSPPLTRKELKGWPYLCDSRKECSPETSACRSPHWGSVRPQTALKVWWFFESLGDKVYHGLDRDLLTRERWTDQSCGNQAGALEA